MAEEKKEVTAEEVTEFLEQHVSKGTKEDTIFTQLSKKTGLGIIASVRTYKQFMKDSGRVLTPDQRKEKIRKAIIEAASGEEGSQKIEDMPSLIDSISKELGLSSTSSAANIRKISEAMGIEVEKKAGNVSEVNAYLIANPNIDRKEFSAWMTERNKTSGTIASYWAKFRFARDCYSAWST